MWRAYLSTSGPDVHARDRIGSGPWHNAKGVLIASNVAELHSDKANINNDTALDEQGRTINAAGRAQPARHPDGLHARRQGDDDDLSELDEQRQRAAARCWGITIGSRLASLDRRGTRPTRRKAARKRIWWRPGEPA